MSSLPGMILNQCVNRPYRTNNKELMKTEILLVCCMSSTELFGGSNRAADIQNNARTNCTALDNIKEQRLRQAIKAEMLPL